MTLTPTLVTLTTVDFTDTWSINAQYHDMHEDVLPFLSRMLIIYLAHYKHLSFK